MELVGSSKRRYAGVISHFFWCFGIFAETGLAYGIRDWKYLQIAITAPMSIILLLYIMYVDIAVDRIHAFKCFKVNKIMFAGLCVLYQTQETVKVCFYPKAPNSLIIACEWFWIQYKIDRHNYDNRLYSLHKFFH